MPSAKSVIIVAILALAFIVFVCSVFAKMLMIGLWIISASTGLASIIHALANYQEARAKHRLMDFVESNQQKRIGG